MRSSSSLRFLARILWFGITALFVVAEIVAVLAFHKIPNGHLFPGLGTRYFIVFIVALPMVAGMNGYYSVRRRLSSAGEDVISVLSVQFLLTVVTAYAALLVCISPLTQALRALRM